MPEITVECSNPDEVRLRVTAEMTIGEWQNLLHMTKDVHYYAPLRELLNAIAGGITAIRERENVKWLPRPSPIPGSRLTPD